MRNTFKVSLWFMAVLLSSALIFFCCSSSDDDDDDTTQDAATDDDDADDVHEETPAESSCKAIKDERIAVGEKFKAGVYRLNARLYASNILVFKALGGIMDLDLWVRLGTSKKDAPESYCYTKEHWGENGENCCAVGDDVCKAGAVLLCMLSVPDKGPNGIDKPYPDIGEDGTFKTKITNIYVPKEINKNLTEDALGDIEMEINILSETCVSAKVNILLKSVKMGSTEFNAVSLRNFDIESWPSQRIDNPEEDPAYGWWERFHLGDEPEIENPFDVDFAAENPDKVTMEPICLDPREEIVRDY